MLKNLTNEQLLEYKQLFENGLNQSKRFESRKINNMDLKFCYHVIRLLNEAEQILNYGDIDLRLNNEQLKAIRRGDVSEKDLRQMACDKEKSLEKLYETSKLPHSPDQEVIKTLLLECLEAHYGSLDNCIINPNKAIIALQEIAKIANKF